MTPDTFNMNIRKGSTFVLVITYSGVDITGYSARMQFRTKIDASAFAYEATTANGKLVLTDAANGEITLTITDTETAAFEGPYVYDLELESAAGVITPLIEGKVYVQEQVTR